MALASEINAPRIRETVEKLAFITNNLLNNHFAPYANIAAAKIKDTALTQLEVSVTHKGGGAAAADVPRIDRFGNLILPEQYGTKGTLNNRLKQNLSLGALSFFTSGTERVFVDASGWNVGIAPAGVAVTEIQIDFISEISVWVVRFDGVDVAFVDPADAGVFVSGLASLDRTASTGANIDFSVTDRINFRNNGAVIGHIKVGGFFAGA